MRIVPWLKECRREIRTVCLSSLILASVAVRVFEPGLVSYFGGIALSTDRDAMRLNVLRRIPPGTSIGEAKKVMDLNGFEFEGKTGWPDYSGAKCGHEIQDYLLFAKTYGYPQYPAGDWEIYLKPRGTRISDCKVIFWHLRGA